MPAANVRLAAKGVGTAAKKVADDADGRHARGGDREREPEEAHRGTGEVKEMAEGEIVEGGIAGEQGRERDAGGEVGCCDDIKGAEYGCRRGDRQQEPAVPEQGETVGGKVQGGQ